MDSDSNTGHSCSVCNKQFSRKFTLARHKDVCHGIATEASERKVQSRSSRIRCTLCSDGFGKISQLITHLQLHHNIALTAVDHVFDSRSDFENWKESTEETTCSYYVKARNFNRKNLKTTYYDCHRSGFYERHGNKRAQKFKGTVRINGTCPARIKLVEDCSDGKHKVNFISTHVGHDNEPERLRLTKQERLDLATKLQQGISKEDILSTLKNNCNPTKRLSFITRHDLNNITSAFNLKGEVKLDEDDANSVNVWMNSCSVGNFNPVLGYKTIGESKLDYSYFSRQDFFLAFSNDGQLDILKLYGNGTVMIESTRETNKYGICLSTLMVFDNNWEGIPVAFMLHTSQTEEAFKLFFECLKNKITVLQPHSFISDDTQAYSAWGKIFDYPDTRLLSTLYVKRTFEQALSSKIVNVDKRNEISQLLSMLHECSDKIYFERSLQTALDIWIGAKGTKKFGLYFQSHFANRTKEWALCYRDQHHKSIAACSEKWYEEICPFKKATSLNMCQQRLDSAINNWINCARARFLNTSVLRGCGNLPVKFSLLRKNHKLCLDVTANRIESVENKKWIVTPMDSGNGKLGEKCQVDLLSVPFICGACNLICSDCGTCVHAFSCSCVDYQVKFNMCIHIHFVCRVHDFRNQQVYTEIIEKPNGGDDLLIIHLGQNEEERRTVVLQDSRQYIGVSCILEEKRNQVHREINNLHLLADKCMTIEQLDMLSYRLMSLS